MGIYTLLMFLWRSVVEMSLDVAPQNVNLTVALEEKSGIVKVGRTHVGYH